MTRKALFEAIRAFLPGGRTFTNGEVQAIDAMADGFGLPREGDGALVPALSLIKQFEGCELSAYPDPGTGGEPFTIGWGATGPGIKKGVTWTQAQADARLATDVTRFMDGVNNLLTSPTSANQRGALTSLAYNIGLRALGGSTLLRKHNARDYAGAAAEFGKWVNASGRRMEGLVRRRAAEAKVYAA